MKISHDNSHMDAITVFYTFIVTHSSIIWNTRDTLKILLILINAHPRHCIYGDTKHMDTSLAEAETGYRAFKIHTIIQQLCMYMYISI